MTFSRHIPDGKTTTAATTAVTKKKSDMPTPPRNCCVTCLARLMRKLKRKGKLFLARGQARSLQCRYDPMSYSLNFDGGACGTLPDDDEDYYLRFYAFSSRYVTNNNIVNKRPPLLLPRDSLSAVSHEFV